MYRPGLSVIILTYNESENISSLIKSIAWTMVESEIPYEIVIIDDHSTDQTSRIVKALAKHYPITFHLKLGKRGMGYSILEGYPLATYEYLAVLDADGRYSPEHLPALLDLAIKHGFAVANRDHLRVGLFQRFVGRIVLGLKEDTYSGLKVFKKEILAHLDHHLVSAWVIDAPLVYTALEHGYLGGYLPITYTPRKRNRSIVSAFTKFGETYLGSF